MFVGQKGVRVNLLEPTCLGACYSTDLAICIQVSGICKKYVLRDFACWFSAAAIAQRSL